MTQYCGGKGESQNLEKEPPSQSSNLLPYIFPGPVGHPTSVSTSYEINFAKDTTELGYFDEVTAQTTARSYKEANSKLSICH